MKIRKKLIDVALPLDSINTESLRRKKKAPKGWSTTFHKWWAQRPIACARAIIFAQIIDDPSSRPELYPTEDSQNAERQRLFKLIEDLVSWDNTHDTDLVNQIRIEINQAWKLICEDNIDHPKAKIIFNPNEFPAFWDPFSGGGSLPLSAQWLGIKTYATDLNPVAVLINKALLEIPSIWRGSAPINPSNVAMKVTSPDSMRTFGLAEDVRYYGDILKIEMQKRIGNLFPPLIINDEILINHSNLKTLKNKELEVVAWIWARTVKSPNPAFSNIDVPLATTFILSSKPGREVYAEPVISKEGYFFRVVNGKPTEQAKRGTKISRGANFTCVMSNTPISSDYIKNEGKAKRIGATLIAVVAESEIGRIFLSPSKEQIEIAASARPHNPPDTIISGSTQYVGVKPYGIERFDELFTKRQLVTLEEMSEAIVSVKEQVLSDAKKAGLSTDNRSLAEGGKGANAYADSISVYLGCIADRVAYYGSTLVGWLPKDSALGPSMPRQAIAMSWDFVEANPFGKSSGDISTCVRAVANYLDAASPSADADVSQVDAQTGVSVAQNLLISTDPPYYDNVPYADLSDFFYVWLRRTLKDVYPELFSTLGTPKSEELVAFAYRHEDGKSGAEQFFLDGMTKAMTRMANVAHPAFPITVYYAFKQSEEEGDDGTASTGWETFLSAVIAAGLTISGTWPLRTEGETRMRGMGSNALASSIVLVCRARETDSPNATRREFISALKSELPLALAHLQSGNIAPVDLAQASIGPGMAVYTKFNKVLDADGNLLTVRSALALINQALDEVLIDQDGDFDAETRWALAWFEQSGFEEGDFGVADQLARAKGTAVNTLSDAGVVSSTRGRVRLVRAADLINARSQIAVRHQTIWESVQRLIHAHEVGGESAASTVVRALRDQAEVARELCYRLYSICERKRRAADAMPYNALVQSWPEIVRLAQQSPQSAGPAGDLFSQE
jgi:putative DNA methylase